MLIPVTYVVINKVKQVEDMDYFDHKTDFNPFSLKH